MSNKTWNLFEDFVSLIDDKYHLTKEELAMVSEIEDSICDLESIIEDLESEISCSNDDEDEYARRGIGREDFL